MPGVVWRSPSVDEAAQLADLYEAWAEGSGLTWRISAEEIAHEMSSPDTDLTADYRLAVDEDSRSRSGSRSRNGTTAGCGRHGKLTATPFRDH
jgi:hypothetical protein